VSGNLRASDVKKAMLIVITAGFWRVKAIWKKKKVTLF
jgi:hypothetical protein